MWKAPKLKPTSRKLTPKRWKVRISTFFYILVQPLSPQNSFGLLLNECPGCSQFKHPGSGTGANLVFMVCVVMVRVDLGIISWAIFFTAACHSVFDKRDFRSVSMNWMLWPIPIWHLTGTDSIVDFGNFTSTYIGFWGTARTELRS